jgi:cytidylate kinase
MTPKKDVIAISRAIGAGGEEIGQRVAARLNIRYADEEIVVKAAEAAGASVETVAEAEKTPGLIGRILEAIGKTPMVTDSYAVQPVYTEAPVAYEALIERVLRQTAEAGNVLIVGHAASIPLAGRDDLLRVLVTAPSAVRARRLTESGALNAEEAEKAVRDSDEQRRQYLRRFYNVEEELPEHYDIVINTEAVGYGTAAEMICHAATD